MAASKQLDTIFPLKMKGRGFILAFLNQFTKDLKIDRKCVLSQKAVEFYMPSSEQTDPLLGKEQNMNSTTLSQYQL